MSIKQKLLIPVIIITTLMAVIVLGGGIIVFNNYVENSISTDVETLSLQVDNQIAKLWDSAEISSGFLANDYILRAAIENGDRDAVISRTKNLYNTLSTDFVTITDTTGTVIYRQHEPDNFGDSVASQVNVTEALKGTVFTELEQGSAVKLSIRAGFPVLSETGDVIGVVSSGYRFDTEDFVEEMKSITNAEVTIFLGDTRLSTTVVGADGQRAVGTKATESVANQVLGGGTYLGQTLVAGKNAFTHYSPLKDSRGDVVGMVFVGEYTEEADAALFSFTFACGLIAVAVIIVAVIILTVTITKMLSPIVLLSEYLTEVGDTGDLVTCDSKYDILFTVAKNKDEIGSAISSFEKLLNKFSYYGKKLELIADKDFSVKVHTAGARDTMGNSIISLLSHMNDVFAEITRAQTRVYSGSQQIASASKTLAEGATEQAASIEELSNSVEAVSTSVKLASDSAREASNTADNVTSIANVGKSQMDAMVKAVTDINAASQNIKNVIKVIDDIAFQTNILALNAAVEAARAGEAGKGFAVVADEVRNLAAKSAAAAKETSDMIADSMAKAAQGVTIANQTSSSLNEIIDGIAKSRIISADIAAKTLDQSHTISEINTGLIQVSQIVQTNTATSEESAAAADDLSAEFTVLSKLIEEFRLKQSQK
ncbi:MAG: methyl-accepting chemotaxis protein [Ruminococcus sp.]|jgi:methyl-accepting chemotaxis protein|nr:methyl-accepting chemotaxis protein [Ruminococcus sp.]